MFDDKLADNPDNVFYGYKNSVIGAPRLLNNHCYLKVLVNGTPAKDVANVTERCDCEVYLKIKDKIVNSETIENLFSSASHSDEAIFCFVNGSKNDAEKLARVFSLRHIPKYQKGMIFSSKKAG